MTFKVLLLQINFTFLLANIWDNIFGNQNAPWVYIPPNFYVQLGVSRVDSPYVLDMYYSTMHNSIKIKGIILNELGKMVIYE
jgi:hypothetical protein